MTAAAQCRVPGCARPIGRGRLCWTHCERWRHHRDFDHNEWTTADLDDVETAAAVRELLPGMTRRERVLLGLVLTDRGLPASEVARITRVSPRTVTRWRRNRRAQQEGTEP
ncbi:helix-turn-helix domain-containing protein [Streptomyces sp. PTD5-9]|uniref:helix-turn-helix domain-containing protein n=1 Tax=Streptomyces sp. PTD5-9 TaxID=3120150 RepID=UPI00300A7D5D